MDLYTSEDRSRRFVEISDSGNVQGNTPHVSEEEFGVGSSMDDDNYSKAQSDSSIQKQGVAIQEHRAVNRSKQCVTLFLVLAACATAAATYQFVGQQERNDFEDQFHSSSTEIVLVTRQNVNQLFNALKSFSISASSEVIATNQTWPFVTISDWSVKARSLGELIGVPEARLAFCPMVDEAHLANWDLHTMEDAPGWYQDSIDSEGLNTTVTELMAKTTPLIHYYDSESGYKFAPPHDTALPIWQHYPLGIEPIPKRTNTNVDMMTIEQFSQLFYLANATRNAAMGFSETVLEEAGEARPLVSSHILQPIFKTADTKSEDREMAGVISLSLEWTSYFEGFFAEGSGGITLVLRHTCHRWNLVDQGVTEEEVNVVSYEINGPQATFLGEYDAHDLKYDSLEVASTLVDLDVDTLVGIPSSGQCIPKISLHLYPIEILEATFYTPKRFIYAGVVIAIFAFTSAVFSLHDYFVARRQRKVTDPIMMQDQMVANIFPTKIRERLCDGMRNSARARGNVAHDVETNSTSKTVESSFRSSSSQRD